MSAAAPSVGTLPPSTSGVEAARRLLRRGRARQALELVDAARSAPHDDVVADHEVELLALAVECHLALGDLALATLLGPDLTDLGADSPVALAARAELASALADPETAAELFLAAGRAGGDDVRPVLPWRSGAALALLRAGRRREALELAHAHHASVQLHGTAADVALALRTLATASSDGHRQTRLRDARHLLAYSESDRLEAQIDTDLAGLLLLDGAVGEAVALLRTVETFAGRHDLWPLQSRVRRLLERMGETPRRMEAEALAILTTAERRVAMLAIDGLTNREIATRLTVSVKAVEGHLSKVYRKLGIGSRSALIATVTRRD